jgi:hypothetical protein
MKMAKALLAIAATILTANFDAIALAHDAMPEQFLYNQCVRNDPFAGSISWESQR